MPVVLPNAAAESDADIECVLLFCLGGLTLSLYSFHLLPTVMVDALLLACVA